VNFDNSSVYRTTEPRPIWGHGLNMHQNLLPHKDSLKWAVRSGRLLVWPLRGRSNVVLPPPFFPFHVWVSTGGWPEETGVGWACPPPSFLSCYATLSLRVLFTLWSSKVLQLGRASLGRGPPPSNRRYCEFAGTRDRATAKFLFGLCCLFCIWNLDLWLTIPWPCASARGRCSSFGARAVYR
jgi:hypothetical protein